MHDSHYISIAVASLRKGATRGMLRQQLKKEGVNDEMVERVLAKTYAKFKARIRFVGFLQAIAGFAIVATGGYLICLVPRAAKIGSVVIMVGLMLATWGAGNVWGANHY